MHTTLVGVFLNPRDAQTAYWNLASAGIDRGDIRLRRERTAQIPSGPRHGATLQRVLGRISHWLAQPFGAAHDQARTAATARQGHAVVTVVFADEERVEELSALLEACGAVDIDESVEQWPGDLGMPPSRARRDVTRDRRPLASAFGAFDRRIGF
jgi:hypothetical protein